MGAVSQLTKLYCGALGLVLLFLADIDNGLAWSLAALASAP
jgi:hypothetical protein